MSYCWICKKRIWPWQKAFGELLHLACFKTEFFAGHLTWASSTDTRSWGWHWRKEN